MLGAGVKFFRWVKIFFKEPVFESIGFISGLDCSSRGYNFVVYSTLCIANTGIKSQKIKKKQKLIGIRRLVFVRVTSKWDLLYITFNPNKPHSNHKPSLPRNLTPKPQILPQKPQLLPKNSKFRFPNQIESDPNPTLKYLPQFRILVDGQGEHCQLIPFCISIKDAFLCHLEAVLGFCWVV